MEYMFDEIGFKCVKRDSCGQFWGPLKKAVMTPIGWVAKIFMRGRLLPGEILVYVGALDQPAESLSGRSSLYFKDENYLKDADL